MAALGGSTAEVDEIPIDAARDELRARAARLPANWRSLTGVDDALACWETDSLFPGIWFDVLHVPVLTSCAPGRRSLRWMNCSTPWPTRWSTLNRPANWSGSWSTCELGHPYEAKKAIDLVKEMSFAKFDETVEVAIRLGVDPRHADQVVRGTVVLPAGTGKTMRVLVIAAGPRRRKRRMPAPTSSAPSSREDQGRLARFRRADRHAGPDGSARPARPRARSPRPHAESEGRHGHVRRRQGRARDRRAARSSSASTRAATCTLPSARSRSSPMRSRPTSRR